MSRRVARARLAASRCRRAASRDIASSSRMSSDSRRRPASNGPQAIARCGSSTVRSRSKHAPGRRCGRPLRISDPVTTSRDRPSASDPRYRRGRETERRVHGRLSRCGDGVFGLRGSRWLRRLRQRGLVVRPAQHSAVDEAGRPAPQDREVSTVAEPQRHDQCRRPADSSCPWLLPRATGPSLPRKYQRGMPMSTGARWRS